MTGTEVLPARPLAGETVAALVLHAARVLVRAQAIYARSAVGSDDARRARELIQAVTVLQESVSASAWQALGWRVDWERPADCTGGDGAAPFDEHGRG
jgi:hypothetical protein